MTKRMLIDAAHAGETRVAIVENERIYDYDFVTSAKAQVKGNIYLAKITRVEPSLQAAFVEYGGGKQGFLPFAEIHPDYYQLPSDDKQKLLAEQIAEAEAEEQAEEEAFEREQAAREARQGRRGRDNEENGEEDLAPEPEELQSDAAPVAVEPTATSSAPLPEVAAIELSQAFAEDDGSEPPSLQSLESESYAVTSDVIEDMPEDISAEQVQNTEETIASEGSGATETTSEEAEETRGRRGGRPRASHRRYRIQEVIRRNQIVLVQVIKEERGNKGCSLTTYISLAGRAAVLMPNSPKGGGISRKISDRETRKRLKEVAAEMRTHRGMSVIIRTAGIDRTKAEIRKDYEYLVKLWNQIRETTLQAVAPALIYEEGNLIKRALRDQYTSDIEEVIIEGEEAFTEAKEFMTMLMPSSAARIKQYKENMPLFAYSGIEEQLAGMMEPQVRLRSGGYIVIHSTEALIAIDVNSGRSTTERNVEETALKTNMEAATEVARQLRLRDLAGLIVVDFIDMNYGKNRKAVERTMKDALRHDRAKIQVGRISMFGLMELSRQRMRPSMSESMGVQCPHCRGTGYIHSVETVAIQIIRTLEKEAANGQYAVLRVTTHPEAALYLLNEKRAVLQSLEQRYNVSVVVLMDASIITGHYRLIKITSEGKEVLHEDARSQPKGGAARKRRGRRGGRGRDDAVTFEGEEDASENENTSGPEEQESGEGEPRRGGRDRGRRGGGRDRNRRGGRDRNRYEERTSEPQAEGEQPVAAEGGLPSESSNGEPRHGEREGGARRRGRRGGRNRNRSRGERGEQGERSEAAPATGSSNDAPATYYSGEETSREQPTPKKESFVIPLSEAQTNPNAIASPIKSESGEGKEKKRGWWNKKEG